MPKPTLPKLRFAVGDRVLCNCADKGWLSGTIEELFVKNPKGEIYAAYKIKLDANKTGIPSCTAPSDKDNVIRKEADGPPPAPEGSTAVVVPPKIETLEEKKIRKLKYKKAGRQ